MTTPFCLVPWDTDFLAALHHMINEATEHHPERAVVVFPHDRPRRYLLEHFRAEGRPLLLPRMLAVNELFACLRPRELTQTGVVREAGLIDRIALVLACCRDVAQDDATLSRRLLQGGEAAFFPWGERLAAVLEECLTQNITPSDLHHAESEVAPFAADLLTALGRIFSRYVTLLPERGRTTPGFDAFCAAAKLVASAHEQGPAPLPLPLGDNLIFLAGFHTLSGTENLVLRHLWQRGARVVLHSDPALAAPHHRAQTGEQVHWSCTGHARWIHAWKTECELFAADAAPHISPGPKLHFFAGYDLHSQLEQLATDLGETEAPDSAPRSAAVALTHPELLLPVLHHLPHKDCNISLGYPLERTLLHRLLDTILELVEQRTADGLVPWRALSDLCAHPWLRQLHPDCDKANNEKREHGTHASFATLLHQCDALIRNGKRLQDPEVLIQQAASAWRADHAGVQGELAPPLMLLDRVFEHCLRTWARAQDLGDLADCLAGLAELLSSAGAALWPRFPLDAECLARLVHHVIPPLRDNDLAATPLPAGLRHTMLRTLLRAERVPFEADPITGLQVLGMLETRLLRFDRVFIVDATDDALPGPPGHDPLLPDSLRSVLGLPDAHQREVLAAHTFHRLLAGAREVFLYWQEGGSPSGLLDAAKQRSRLVEALLWNEEQRLSRLLEIGQAPLRAPSLHLRPPRRAHLSLKRTPIMQDAVDKVLAAGLTPARLDAYLTCPLAFYYRYIARLNAPDTVNEGDDPAAVGDLLHTVLFEAFTPWKDRILRRGDLAPETLTALFATHLAASDLRAALPPESAAMLEVAGPRRLRRFLDAAPERTTIRQLETDLAITFSAPEYCDLAVPLRGRADRIDERQEMFTNDILADATDSPRTETLVLDYKSGRPRLIAPQVWEDEALWDALRTWLAQKDASDDAQSQGDTLLMDLAERMPSIQLPCYIAMLTPRGDTTPLLNAAWIELGEAGSEYPLFPPTMDRKARQLAVSQQIPLLLAFLINHLRDAANFCAREGAHCDWCLFKNLCMITK